MEINKSIFKSYDIRGIYPSELNEEAAFNIGAAFVRHTGFKKIAVGYDARISCLGLLNALARGVYSEGGELYNIGQVSTECLYFAVATYDFPAGIMITASHNPKEYNGFKMVKKDGGNIKIMSGKELLPSVKEVEFKKAEELEIEKKDVWHDYLNHVLSFVDLSEIMPMKIVVDASNGVAGSAISKIQDKLPVEIIPLNFEPDGNFPNHGPNPVAEGSADQIGEAIRREKADMGFIFDGDADRIFLVDENGLLVKSDATILLLAKYFLEKNPGMGIVRHVTCSRAIPEFVKKWGGVPIRTKVGFIYIQEGLKEHNGIMGGELSGHYCFKDNFYCDSGMIAFLSLLKILSMDQKKVSEIAKELAPYVRIDSEFKIKGEDKDAIIEKVKEKYSDGKQDFLDGITVEYEDWWFNIRSSNTEPILRLTVEADTDEILQKKQKELTKFISK